MSLSGIGNSSVQDLYALEAEKKESAASKNDTSKVEETSKSRAAWNHFLRELLRRKRCGPKSASRPSSHPQRSLPEPSKVSDI